jgi:hypothetical protein
MKDRRHQAAYWGVVAGCLAGLIVACSSSKSSSSGPDAGADATSGDSSGGSGGCQTQADCDKQLPQTNPPNCATATCDVLSGQCSFAAKDEDGDMHTAAKCAAVGGGHILTGDDCDDHDANLYPGHPKDCATLPDGGVPGSACSKGAVSCRDDGSLSACENAVFCDADKTCVDSKCAGMCGPGQTQCSSDLTGVETCDESGAWGSSVACMDETCGSSGGIARCGGTCTNNASGSCGLELHALGACASGTTTCTGGVWGACSVTPAANDTCDPGNDANCNGSPNEGCACINGMSTACGVCGGCSSTCTAGTPGPCGSCNTNPMDCSSLTCGWPSTRECSADGSAWGACTLSSDISKAFSATDAEYTHTCGSALAPAVWSVPAGAPLNCVIQQGPGISLRSGSYTWNIEWYQDSPYEGAIFFGTVADSSNNQIAGAHNNDTTDQNGTLVIPFTVTSDCQTLSFGITNGYTLFGSSHTGSPYIVANESIVCTGGNCKRGF